MRKKLPYEAAETEVIIFSAEDIVTASDPNGVSIDQDGWSPSGDTGDGFF